MRIVINGKFLTRPLTGVDRFAFEITHALDEIVAPNEFSVVAPESQTDLSIFENIPIHRTGKHNGILWEQIDLPRYARAQDATLLNLCNIAPLAKSDYTCIHDMQIRANPFYFSRVFVWWYRLLFLRIMKKSPVIFTVSEFSKREIEKYYPGTIDRIEVISSAWQHFDIVNNDETIFDRNPKLKREEYYFALSSLTLNKNLSWLTNVAKANPAVIIAIAGGINSKVFGKSNIPQAENVVYLGYVSDNEAKVLMQNCKGFLFPTFYEGFGLPPLEALACGAQIAVSNTDIMHEVYEDAAHYIDPKNPNIDLKMLFSEPIGDPQRILNKYSWQKSAEKLYTVLKETQ
jgi:glycosyltransferase involved in cell wall biosynthesis